MDQPLRRAPHYTVEEVAAVMGVDPEVVRRWIRDGELSAIMGRRGPGGGYRVSHEDLERYIQARLSPYVALNIPEDKTE